MDHKDDESGGPSLCFTSSKILWTMPYFRAGDENAEVSRIGGLWKVTPQEAFHGIAVVNGILDALVVAKSKVQNTCFKPYCIRNIMAIEFRWIQRNHLIFLRIPFLNIQGCCTIIFNVLHTVTDLFIKTEALIV